MLLQACLHWHKNKIKIALYALEENRQFHLMRVLAQVTGKPELSSSGMEWIRDNPGEVREILRENVDLLGEFGQRIWARPSTAMTLVDAAKWIEDRAKEGCRVIAVDPITIIDSDKPWIDDKKFIGTVGKIATDYGCSIILVNHPVKGVSCPDMSQLAGSTAYSRFSQNILWLEPHDEGYQSEIMTSDLITCNDTHNRTLHIIKSRNGRGTGKMLAMIFNDSLCLEELGLIVKEEQGSNHQDDLNHRSDNRTEKSQNDLETARANERTAKIKMDTVEAEERGKTEREKMRLEKKTMLPLKNKKKSKRKHTDEG